MGLSIRGAEPWWGDDVDPADDASSSWWLSYSRGRLRPVPSSARRLSIVDFFSGSGGLSLGARLAAGLLGRGVHHRLAVDLDDSAVRVLAANLKSRALTESVAELVSSRVRLGQRGFEFAFPPALRNESLQHLVGDVDLVVAGPPCQGNSTMNNRTRFDDPRNGLYLAVPALAVALRAKTVVIENVPGVTAAKANVVQQSLELLRNSGYKESSGVLAADRIGWPQTHKRFFMVGSLEKSPLDLKQVEKDLLHPKRSLERLIGDLATHTGSGYMFEIPQMSDENRRRIDYLFDNGLYELPNSERPDCHKNGTTYGAVYGRLHGDRPSPTITTGFMTPGRGRYVHPTSRRTLLPAEAARIQGFPDDYDFGINGVPRRTELAKWIGDAVPAPLGMAAILAGLLGRMSDRHVARSVTGVVRERQPARVLADQSIGRSDNARSTE